MRHLFIALILVLSLTGCEDKEQQAKDQAKHDARIAQQAKAELLAELEAKKDAQEKNDTKLTKMGITMNDGTITIDTNKSKDFFRALAKKMDTQIKKMGDDLEKGILQTKEAGIEINEQHIHIDLNKTQELLEKWGKKIQIFAEEFNEITKTLEINSTNTIHKGM